MPELEAQPEAQVVDHGVGVLRVRQRHREHEPRVPVEAEGPGPGPPRHLDGAPGRVGGGGGGGQVPDAGAEEARERRGLLAVEEGVRRRQPRRGAPGVVVAVDEVGQGVHVRVDARAPAEPVVVLRHPLEARLPHGPVRALHGALRRRVVRPAPVVLPEPLVLHEGVHAVELRAVVGVDLVELAVHEQDALEHEAPHPVGGLVLEREHPQVLGEVVHAHEEVPDVAVVRREPRHVQQVELQPVPGRRGDGLRRRRALGRLHLPQLDAREGPAHVLAGHVQDARLEPLPDGQRPPEPAEGRVEVALADQRLLLGLRHHHVDPLPARPGADHGQVGRRPPGPEVEPPRGLVVLEHPRPALETPPLGRAPLRLDPGPEEPHEVVVDVAPLDAPQLRPGPVGRHWGGVGWAGLRAPLRAPVVVTHRTKKKRDLGFLFRRLLLTTFIPSASQISSLLPKLA